MMNRFSERILRRVLGGAARLSAKFDLKWASQDVVISIGGISLLLGLKIPE